jgi:septal ring factor EnvC (AmiA/AmiB activator)
LDILNLIYKETNGKIWIVLKLYKELIKQRGMSVEQVVNIVEIAIHKLPHMESLYKQLKDEVDKLQYIRQGLLNDIAALKYKISILDKTAFSSEQECKRTKQQLQELTAQKNRIEKVDCKYIKWRRLF